MTTEIGMLLFPNLTQLDLTGPFEVFARVPDARMHLLWKDLQPVRSASGLSIVPTTTFADCPPLDVICVPGGIGHVAASRDDAVLAFLRRQAASARYVTSVCTGALVLGAAGLLDGYAATTHWAYTHLLAGFGARFVKQRVVVDRNRITGGGVTAGIDFGLQVVAALAGEEVAKAIQLTIEYNPAPPFQSGDPDTADPALVELVRKRVAEQLARAEARVPGKTE